MPKTQQQIVNETISILFNEGVDASVSHYTRELSDAVDSIYSRNKTESWQYSERYSSYYKDISDMGRLPYLLSKLYKGEEGNLSSMSNSIRRISRNPVSEEYWESVLEKLEEVSIGELISISYESRE